MNEYDIYRLWRGMLSKQLSERSKNVLSVYEDDRELYSERMNAAMLLSSAEGKKLLSADISEAEKTAEICDKAGIGFLTRSSAAYPEMLGRIADPVELLFFMGDPSVLSMPSCAVIGSRQADDYSCRLTRKISRELAERGVTVISGFALGIDRAAHTGALDVNGQTVAVLGCGLLYDYPKGSVQLRDAIAERGAVITEYLPYQRPEPANFPVRNRMTAALARCVLCTQAGERSGSLNTANLAFSMGKPVFVTPPHDILSGSCDGIITLLRDGAVQVYSADDIIRECIV